MADATPPLVEFELNSKQYRGQSFQLAKKSHIWRLELLDNPQFTLPQKLILKGCKDDDEGDNFYAQPDFDREKHFYETYKCESMPTYYGSTTVGGRPFLVLSFINGTPLHEIFPSEVEALGSDLSELIRKAIRDLANIGILHTDMWARNFILGEGKVWVIDFCDWMLECDAVKDREEDGEIFYFDEVVEYGCRHVMNEVEWKFRPRTIVTKSPWVRCPMVYPGSLDPDQRA